MDNKRRKYTKEFKQEAVRLVAVGGRSMTEIAESLGIGASLLSKWVQLQRQDGEEAFRGNGKRTAVEDELWRLKQRNKALEEELAFLKKVSRYFAKDPK
ncbi:MAG: transposase [Proteobacteria bacterium]|nr:transposase [Pseudomonadota bacterium]